MPGSFPQHLKLELLDLDYELFVDGAHDLRHALLTELLVAGDAPPKTLLDELPGAFGRAGFLLLRRRLPSISSPSGHTITYSSFAIRQNVVLPTRRGSSTRTQGDRFVSR